MFDKSITPENAVSQIFQFIVHANSIGSYELSFATIENGEVTESGMVTVGGPVPGKGSLAARAEQDLERVKWFIQDHDDLVLAFNGSSNAHFWKRISENGIEFNALDLSFVADPNEDGLDLLFVAFPNAAHKATFLMGFAGQHFDGHADE